jgi:hypothetical protein
MKTWQETTTETLQKLANEYLERYQKLMEEQQHCTECAENHRLRNEFLSVAKHYQKQAQKITEKG